ncbi:hypothetical protein AGMMS49556_05750 [Endomicrobiia bacterium]|nr:hypothetical protein AGMMS49556_05750 [Endomicrobiia bacterium]
MSAKVVHIGLKARRRSINNSGENTRGIGIDKQSARSRSSSDYARD